jgi:hypothetical protein
MPIILNWEDHSLRPAQAKSPQNSISVSKSWLPWHTPVIPATQEAQMGGSLSRPAHAQQQESHLQNNQSEKGWRHGSSGKVPA